jgi:hypothetical protein
VSSRPDSKAQAGRILPVCDLRSNAASAGWIGAENDRVIHSRALEQANGSAEASESFDEPGIRSRDIVGVRDLSLTFTT